jgi:dihydroorotate dehydrogenase (fumarate)/dihydroorotate dehydrogenase
MSLYSTLIRPLLFKLDAETAHHGTVEACRIAGMVPWVPQLTRACLEFTAPELQCEVAGLRFDHPIGLAAGWDKSGRALRMLDHLGFAFAEIGSISAQPSQGNPQPRLFRLPQDQAIIVNYGLPNEGAEAIAPRLAAHRMRVPLGVNIVKTNFGPGAPACSDEAILADYERSVSLLHRHAGYLMLNLSCPNAAGGKDFYAQSGNITRLLHLLKPLDLACPVFLKVAPRDDPAEHERLLAEADAFDFVRGFSFNLPPGKPATLRLTTPRSEWEHLPGAVSGKPVEDLINRCIAGLATRMNRQRHIIIGTGGVFTAADAYRKLRLGASLVQIYTALIYEGPGVISRINQGLCSLLAKDGFRHVSEAVGADLPQA